MLKITLLIAIAAAVISAQPLRRWWASRVRVRRRAEPLPSAWAEILQQDVPLYRRLPPEMRDRLHGDINVFLGEKQFFGQEGLAITDRMRVVVAAHACLLTLQTSRGHYPDFATILIYPEPYLAVTTSTRAGLETTEKTIRSGESWLHGPLVLAWSEVIRDLEGASCSNVLIHEFAHKLDGLDGIMDGAPPLAAASQQPWAAEFNAAFAAETTQSTAGESGLFDDYDVSHPAEFFAATVELFFVQPTVLEARHEALYQALQRYFQLDPANW